jgi:chaperonin cofactor prefoldin
MKRAVFLLVAPLSLLLAGCLGDVMAVMCEATPDSDHCYQASAVQKGDDDNCDKIGGADFKYSNPPKDKCHLLIAENTGDASTCSKIEGGMMSYTEEECLAAAFKNHTVEDCTTAEDEAACRAAWAKHGRGCGDAYTFVKATGVCEITKDEPKSETEKPFEADAVKEDLQKIGDVGKSKYMELLEWDIEHEKDPDRLAGLQNYKEFLENTGEKLETLQTNFDKLQELKKIFIDSYDPKDAVENMSASSILAPGFFDRLKDKLTGGSTPTEASKAEDALTVYEKMLERQKDNDFLQQSRLSRVGDTLIGKAKDEATSKLKEGVEDIAKGVAGDAFAVVGIVDHALSSFQAEAQKQMFVGLAAAYNRQRDGIAQAHPNWTNEQIHKATVDNVKANPYEDVPNSGFVKYGNIIENGDCKDAGNNPLCIDNRVFWVAMDKTYEVTHKK